MRPSTQAEDRTLVSHSGLGGGRPQPWSDSDAKALLLFRPFNNLQKNLPTSPDYIPGDHRASWWKDPHGQPLTAHPLNSHHYRVLW
jgi:hypothetical protein